MEEELAAEMSAASSGDIDGSLKEKELPDFEYASSAIRVLPEGKREGGFAAPSPVASYFTRARKEFL